MFFDRIILLRLFCFCCCLRKLLRVYLGLLSTEFLRPFVIGSKVGMFFSSMNLGGFLWLSTFGDRLDWEVGWLAGTTLMLFFGISIYSIALSFLAFGCSPFGVNISNYKLLKLLPPFAGLWSSTHRAELLSKLLSRVFPFFGNLYDPFFAASLTSLFVLLYDDVAHISTCTSLRSLLLYSASCDWSYVILNYYASRSKGVSCERWLLMDFEWSSFSLWFVNLLFYCTFWGVFKSISSISFASSICSTAWVLIAPRPLTKDCCLFLIISRPLLLAGLVDFDAPTLKSLFFPKLLAFTEFDTLILVAALYIRFLPWSWWSLSAPPWTSRDPW